MVTNTTADLLVTTDGEKVKVRFTHEGGEVELELSAAQAALLANALIDATWHPSPLQPGPF